MMQISESIINEADFFLISIASGSLMVLVYDVLRVFRRLIKHGTIWIAVEDIIYWVSCAFFVFAMLYQKNDGLIRWFAIGGLIVGMLLYNHFISRWAIGAIVWLMKKIIHILICPIHFLAERLKKPASFCRHKLSKSLRLFRKLLKKIYKTIKMGLCKL